MSEPYHAPASRGVPAHTRDIGRRDVLRHLARGTAGAVALVGLAGCVSSQSRPTRGVGSPERQDTIGAIIARNRTDR